MMNKKDVECSILCFFRERFGVDVPSAEFDLLETGVLDSMMFVDLMMFIEERFHVTAALEDLEIENFATVSNMANFVAARRAGADPGAAQCG